MATQNFSSDLKRQMSQCYDLLSDNRSTLPAHVWAAFFAAAAEKWIDPMLTNALNSAEAQLKKSDRALHSAMCKEKLSHGREARAELRASVEIEARLRQEIREECAEISRMISDFRQQLISALTDATGPEAGHAVDGNPANA